MQAQSLTFDFHEPPRPTVRVGQRITGKYGTVYTITAIRGQYVEYRPVGGGPMRRCKVDEIRSAL